MFCFGSEKWKLRFRRLGTSNSLTRSIVVLGCALTLSNCAGNAPESISERPAKPATFDSKAATARVFGTVLLEGKAPEPGPLKVIGDPFCRTNTQGMKAEDVSVSPNGGLRNAIVYVRSGFEGRTYDVSAQPVTLDQQRCIYLPHVLTLMKNQKLKIINSDPTFHNVHAQRNEATVFNIAQATKGAEDFQSFPEAALPLRIGCDFHKWMASYVGVFEHPFHTVSGDGGAYELHLPPGKYEVAIWHEKFGESVSSIEVQGNGSTELNFRLMATKGD